MTTPTRELILGGTKSGKSRAAEARAVAWLEADREHQATLVATALPGDDEMGERIARHRADRLRRIPTLDTVETPHDLGATLRRLAHARRLLVVDCLTLWLTQCLLPPLSQSCSMNSRSWPEELDALMEALRESPSPIVLVSNEIGLGVMPMSREARECIDALGMLHQAVATHCCRVTLMVAGCELRVKDCDGNHVAR